MSITSAFVLVLVAAVAQVSALDLEKVGGSMVLIAIVAILVCFGCLFCLFRCIGWMCGCNRAQNVTVYSGTLNNPDRS
jgi:hypothetical protein